MDKKAIIRNFSRYAHLYDNYSDIQRESAVGLLDCVKGKNIKNILEIGCGTGHLTVALIDKFKGARIKALDISPKMVGIAKKKLKNSGVEFFSADGEEFSPAEKFDLIVSHACFQWFNDLDRALEKCKGLLKENGEVVFSAFGPLTFCELNFSLKAILKSPFIQAEFFLNKPGLKLTLSRHFGKVKIREARYEEEFLSLNDLLRKIKYSGIRGSGVGRGVQINRGILKELEKVYLNKFGRIKATYQVFFCRAG